MKLKPKIFSNKSWQDSKNLMKKVSFTEILNLEIFWLPKIKPLKYQISGWQSLLTACRKVFILKLEQEFTWHLKF